MSNLHWPGTDLEIATHVGAELILIDVPLQFEPVGVWAGEW